MLAYPLKGSFRISQGFGENPDYYKQFGLAGHEGVDWACPNGTPVYASEAGKVVRRSDNFKDSAYGIYVVIWHDKLNLGTWYCHLEKVLVSIGDYVERGQLIATSDNTGNTTGAHLHFNVSQTDSNGVRINKDNGYQGFVDPMPYLEEQEITCPSPCQEIIDGLRSERDTNWNLYKDEQADHLQTKADLQACKTEKENLWRWIEKWSSDLDVPVSSEKIDAEIQRLMTIEDACRECPEKLTELEKEVKDLTEQLTLEQAKSKVLENDKKTLQTSLSTCQTEKGKLFTDLQKCNEQSKPCEEMTSWAILMCFLASLKGGDKNADS